MMTSIEIDYHLHLDEKGGNCKFKEEYENKNDDES